MLGAVCAWEQNGGTAPGSVMITIAGQVVNRISTSDDIRLEEQGPGGVSSLELTIDDPALAYSFQDGDAVRVWDTVNDRPLFTGFVKGPIEVSVFGTGRRLAVNCTGIEAVLDWILSPSVTFDATLSPATNTLVQSLVGQSFGVGVPLNTAAAITDGGDRANPVGWATAVLVRTTTIPAGSTLRQGIQQLLEASGNATGQRPVVTVDFYCGLRVYSQLSSAGAIGAQTDYSSLTIDDANFPSVLPQATAPTHITDGSDLVRAVYVVGGNAAGTGIVSDGSGIPGPTAVISDSSILTALDRDRTAALYLAGHIISQRGVFSIDSVTLTTNIRAGSRLLFVDLQMFGSITQQTFIISAIEKRFIGTTQHWRVTYGKLPPSAMRQLRRFTRSTLN